MKQMITTLILSWPIILRVLRQTEAVENAIDNSTGMAYEVMNLPPHVIGVQVS
jgi:hypothetical protein